MTQKLLPKPRWWYDSITPEALAYIEQLQAEKWILLYAEYGSDGVEGKTSETHAKYFPISDGLVERLYAWIRLLNELSQEIWEDEAPPDVRPLADMGYEIAVAIKKELPDWTVTYADGLLYYLTPSGDYGPEILADGSLGETVVPGWRGEKVDPLRNGYWLFQYRRHEFEGVEQQVEPDGVAHPSDPVD